MRRHHYIVDRNSNLRLNACVADTSMGYQLEYMCVLRSGGHAAMLYNAAKFKDLLTCQKRLKAAADQTGIAPRYDFLAQFVYRAVQSHRPPCQ